MKCQVPLAVAGFLCSTVLLAQPVRLEFRLVPQEGLLPGPISDVPVPALITGAGQVRRFELQYRVLDLDLTDEIVPAGLADAKINIVMEPAGVGTLDRALLSQFEANQAGATPPTSPDDSGAATGVLSGAAGLHRPFRGLITVPPPNNNHFRNGTVTSTGILRIEPVTLSQSDQGNADAGFDNQAWYGLYSFTWTSNTLVPAGGTLNFRAETVAEASTGARFRYFNALGRPAQDANTTAATAQIAWAPTPSSLPALLMAGGVIGIRRRRA